MVRCRCRGWLACAALLLPVGVAGAQATLRVTVTGIRAAQGGTLLVALYDRGSAWLTLDSALVVQRIAIAASADSVLATFEGLAPGDGYAVAVVHDRNGNDRMDMRWLPWPKPKEGAGVSGNHLRNGKPRYEQARFAVAGDAQQRITMRY